jgi:hypothetical protein
MCKKLEKVEGEKAMNVSNITTKVSAYYGVLGQLDASFLVVKLHDFVNMPADLSALKILHYGKGFVTRKETKEGISTFSMKYLETEAGSRAVLSLASQFPG